MAEAFQDTQNLPHMPEEQADRIIEKAKAAGKVIALSPPHSAGQREMILWPGSGAAFCGRRWGKTHAGVQRLLRSISTRPGLYWWVGLSWKSASMKRAWRELKFWCSLAIKESGKDPRDYINNSNFEIRLPNGAEIWLRTAERPESLAGEGIMGAVVDEFTLMPEIIWTEYLQGTLLDYEGWALFIGVPKNELWAINLWRKSMAGELGPSWKAWTFTSYDNPEINKLLLDDMRTTVPDLIFRQEYMAQIVSESGGVFRGVRDAATAVAQERAIPGHIYTMGCDFARVHDYTVYAIIDVTLGECVAMDRFRGVEYAIQVDRFMSIYAKFKPAIVLAESNNMGDPIIEQMNIRLRDPNEVGATSVIIPFVTGVQSKDTLIRAWANAIETGQVKLPQDEVVIGEHQIYEMTQTASGLGWRYSAPGTDHDDTIIAHALAWHARGDSTPSMPDDFSISSFTQKSIISGGG
jgi:hypothetical protein